MYDFYSQKKLCSEVSGTRIAYIQSDEISLLLVDYAKLTTEPWFGNRLAKMCSIAASIASVIFNEQLNRVLPKLRKRAVFDCRAFDIPRDEVVNYFIWRQQDAVRNSISSLAQAHFSH